MTRCINATKLIRLPRLSQAKSMQCTQCTSCRVGALASLHFPAFLPWALLLARSTSFQCETICSPGKGGGRPRRDSVSSGELTTLWLNGRRHSSSSGSAAFHPNTRAAAAEQAAGVGRVVRGGGAGGARQRRAEERAPPRKRPSPPPAPEHPLCPTGAGGERTWSLVKSTVSFPGETMHQ